METSNEGGVASEQPPSLDPLEPEFSSGSTGTAVIESPSRSRLTGEFPKITPPNLSKSKSFQKRFFPETTDIEWNDWRWQLSNRLRDYDSLARVLNFSDEEKEIFARLKDRLPVAVTPYYASLLDPDNPNHPLRRSVIPVIQELVHSPGEAEDPLAEDSMSPVPGIVHRYPDRVLFLVSDTCSVHCRYCTRSRMVATGRVAPNRDRWEKSIEYIEENPEIRDVLLSGGDPLTLSDENIEYLLSRLRQIRHVEVIRIGTKAPVALPQRITPKLTQMLKRYHPVWMSIHVTHPEELTMKVTRACERLADAGIPLGSQTVLLKGINDDLATMKKLFQGLMRIRVRPYYLYQCDPITGSSHFRTPVEKGLEIISGLRGHTSGYAVPNFVIDAPGGGGKIVLIPESVVGRNRDEILLKNYQGRVFSYPDPVE